VRNFAAILLIGCGGSEAKPPAPPVTNTSTGEPAASGNFTDGRSLSSMTKPEREAWCKQEYAETNRIVSKAETKRAGCQMTTGMALISSDLSDDISKACQEQVATCVSAPDEPATCEIVDSECDITIGEIRQCIAEVRTRMREIANTDFCANLTVDNLAGRYKAFTDLGTGAGCHAVNTKCPQ
jgi:hypothetical protein